MSGLLKVVFVYEPAHFMAYVLSIITEKSEEYTRNAKISFYQQQQHAEQQQQKKPYGYAFYNITKCRESSRQI